MPTKKTWLLRLPEIRMELVAMKVPVVDRTVFERLFGVRRRRAIQLLHYFNGYQSGRTFLIDRISLIEQLAPLEASADFALEHRRRQRLVESLESLRRARVGARVVIPVDLAKPSACGLPAGVQLDRGQLCVRFDDACDLLAKLYAVAQAAATDFESFCAAADGAACSTASAPGAGPRLEEDGTAKSVLPDDA
jgi:hypothetical protein